MPPNTHPVLNIVLKNSLGQKGPLKGNLIQAPAMGMDALN